MVLYITLKGANVLIACVDICFFNPRGEGVYSLILAAKNIIHILIIMLRISNFHQL